jgi:hypothetical protein
MALIKSPKKHKKFTTVEALNIGKILLNKLTKDSLPLSLLSLKNIEMVQK